MSKKKENSFSPAWSPFLSPNSCPPFFSTSVTWRAKGAVKNSEVSIFRKAQPLTQVYLTHGLMKAWFIPLGLEMPEPPSQPPLGPDMLS